MQVPDLPSYAANAKIHHFDGVVSKSSNKQSLMCLIESKVIYPSSYAVQRDRADLNKQVGIRHCVSWLEVKAER